jgi:hypothetical protein
MLPPPEHRKQPCFEHFYLANIASRRVWARLWWTFLRWHHVSFVEEDTCTRGSGTIG